MKKRHGFLLVFLLAAALFVFFTGWTQFKVPQGSVGVLVTKTGGTHPVLIESGKFSWNWEFLLPTNATLHVFSVKARKSSNTIEGNLPSARIYGDALPSRPDFSYSIAIDMTARASSEGLARLFSDGVEDDESLDAYLDSACAKVSQAAASYIIDRLSRGDSFRAESIGSDELLSAARAAKDFPDVVFADARVSSARLPDMALYEAARQAFFVSAQVKQERLEDKRKKIGELLKEFPELRQEFPGLAEKYSAQGADTADKP